MKFIFFIVIAYYQANLWHPFFGGFNNVFKEFDKEIQKMNKFDSFLGKDLLTPFKRQNFLPDLFKPHSLFAFRKPKKNCKY